MRSTIDKAGRLVIPKPLRDQLGLRPGEVELTADGAALRVVPVHEDKGDGSGDGRGRAGRGHIWHARPLCSERHFGWLRG